MGKGVNCAMDPAMVGGGNSSVVAAEAEAEAGAEADRSWRQT